MSHTITVRLDADLAAWLEEESRRSGVAQGRIVRQQVELARAGSAQRFMRLAGSVKGARDLSSRKGFYIGEAIPIVAPSGLLRRRRRGEIRVRRRPLRAVGSVDRWSIPDRPCISMAPLRRACL